MKAYLILSIVILSFCSYGSNRSVCQAGDKFDSTRGVCVKAEIVSCRVSSMNNDGSETEFIDVDLKTSRVGVKVNEYVGINGYTLAFNFHKESSKNSDYSIYSVVTHMFKEGDRSVGATATSKTLPISLAIHDTDTENDLQHTMWIICGGK